ncbi:aldo/keto reductase [Vibrio pectenicida]|uniref:Aldo/keto reductase n=1 Tax=Vibrio pectenicida TaxID=62763 RepID=A0A7Y4ECT8_9VIBR|nr:aldo/keto reductase [Vibrio pectenicida]NOH70985.1 aldo/keto reductase [Vibrio pectenicida]
MWVLGCNNLGLFTNFHQAERLIKCAIEFGIDSFDTSPSYGKRHDSERYLGQILSKTHYNTTVCTKMIDLPSSGIDIPSTIKQSILSSAHRLQRQKIDKLLLPKPFIFQHLVSLLETISECIDRQLVGGYGFSDVTASELSAVCHYCTMQGLIQPSVIQNEVNLLTRPISYEMIQLSQCYQIKIWGYAPLAGGILTGKYLGLRTARSQGRYDSYPDTHRLNQLISHHTKLQQLDEIAAKNDCLMSDIALEWAQSHSAADCIIIGARTEQQLVQCLSRM